ncbi:MAG: gliding motility-associated C-terminal domain-containing protein [Bacteroidales bacterium]|nr:gliding motility-associated C-terminal domain-containing protein [Bacteroidales bacterium]
MNNKITSRTLSRRGSIWAAGIACFMLMGSGAFAQIPGNGLKGHWLLDGNVSDASGNGNNGTLLSGAAYCPDRFGVANRAVKLDGFYNSGAIHIPNSPSLYLDRELTVACWFKLDDAGGMDAWGFFSNTTEAIHNFISKDGDRGGFNLSYAFNFAAQAQDIGFSIHNNTVCSNVADFTYSDSQSCINTEWRHVAVVVDSISITMYINGMQKHRETYSSQIHFTQANVKDLDFGRYGYNCGVEPNYWYPLNGRLDDIVYYNRALSQSEINALYNYPAAYAPPSAMVTLYRADTVSMGEAYEENGFSLPAQNEAGLHEYSRTNGCDTVWMLNLTVASPCDTLLSSIVTDGLIAWYPFNGNAHDETPNANHGTVYGATLTADRYGNPNSAYHFDGINDWIEIPNAPQLSALTTDFTISFWIKSLSNNISPFCKSASNALPIQFRIQASYNNQTNIHNISLLFNGSEFLFAYHLPVNEWYQIVMIFENSSCRLFIDNTEAPLVNVTSNNYPFNVNNNLYIGKDPHGTTEYHLGDIDDIMIYQRGLSDEEVSVIYNGTVEIFDTICESEPYNNNGISLPGQTVAGDSVHMVNLQNAAGCDSTVILHLTVKPLHRKTIIDTICSSDPFNFYGSSLSTSGTYTAAIPGAECDTVVTLLLTVNQAWNNTLNISICEGESYLFNGDTCTEPGTWTANLQTVAGCDSITTLHLTVSTPYTVRLEDICCMNELYQKHGFSLTPPPSPGIYEYMLQLKTAAGCDSIVTLRLTVPEVAVEIDMTPKDFCEKYYTELTALTDNTDIKWSTGETAPSIAVTSRGHYAVTASDSSGKCTATATIEIAPCKPLLLLPNTITPGNPDGINDQFYLSNPDAFETVEIYIYNRWGNCVFSSHDPGFRWDGKFKGELQSRQTFSYIIYYTPLQDKKQAYAGTVLVL